MRKQYHFRPSERGLRAWDVDRLIELSKDLRRTRVRLDSISEVDEVYWFDDDEERPTCRKVILHARLIAEADLAYPIILSADGHVMDGMHRIGKAILEQREDIEALRFETDPEPDYVGRRPSELPYDDWDRGSEPPRDTVSHRVQETFMPPTSSDSGRPTGPFDLSRTPIHLGSQLGAENPAVPQPGFGFDGPSFESYIAAHCKPDAPGRLIMVESTPVNWAAWECHDDGDEIVIVLEGKGEFIQEVRGEERRIPVGPGSAIINPKGVWHTADVEEPIKAIYITPIPGTQHRER